MTSFLLKAAEEAAATAGATARPHSEAQLVLPNLGQVKFLGMSGSTLLMLGLVVCAIGFIFGLASLLSRGRPRRAVGEG